MTVLEVTLPLKPLHEVPLQYSIFEPLYLNVPASVESQVAGSAPMRTPPTTSSVVTGLEVPIPTRLLFITFNV